MTTPIPEPGAPGGVRQDCQWSTWSHVRVDMQVALKNRGWLVSAKDDQGMTLTPNGGGEPLTGPPPPPGAPVLVLYPGHPMYAVAPARVAAAAALMDSTAGHPAVAAQLAVAAVTLHLAGHVLATRPLAMDGEIPDPAVPFDCPDPSTMPGAHLRAHLVLFHDLSGLATDVGSAPLPTLQALHSTTAESTHHTHGALA